MIRGQGSMLKATLGDMLYAVAQLSLGASRLSRAQQLPVGGSIFRSSCTKEPSLAVGPENSPQRDFQAASELILLRLSKSMSSDSKIEISTELLRRLHRIHRQRTDLNSQIARGPRQIQAGEALVAKAAEAVTTAKEKLKKANMTSDEKQLQLKSREARIEELAAKLNTAASNREFNTLKEQIAADKQANSVQSDEILEAMDVIEKLEVDLQSAESELLQQQSDHETRTKEVEAKMTELRSELERVEGELGSSESKIPAAALGDYKRLTEAKGEEALAPVEDESCGGCYQRLTTQYIDRLRMSILIRCPNCNAFLYLPEDRRV